MKRCRGCGRIIRFIRTLAGHRMPVNTQPTVPDGKQVLVFADGTVGKEHAKLRHGFTSHFASCPKAELFKSRPKRPRSRRARAARR